MIQWSNKDVTDFLMYKFPGKIKELTSFTGLSGLVFSSLGREMCCRYVETSAMGDKIFDAKEEFKKKFRTGKKPIKEL